jgi:hypothetical protein
VDPSVVASHSAVFDLSSFDGGPVTVRFQFGSDSFEGGVGANIDNVRITGAIPEPSTLVLAVMGFAALGLKRRRRRSA